MTVAALIRKRETGKPANDNPAKAANDGRVRDEPLAGLAALALANPPATKAMNQDEREIVAWLHRIGEPDPVVFGETLDKCRTNPTYRAAFLSMARGDDGGTVH